MSGQIFFFERVTFPVLKQARVTVGCVTGQDCNLVTVDSDEVMMIFNPENRCFQISRRDESAIAVIPECRFVGSVDKEYES